MSDRLCVMCERHEDVLTLVAAGSKFVLCPCNRLICISCRQKCSMMAPGGAQDKCSLNEGTFKGSEQPKMSLAFQDQHQEPLKAGSIEGDTILGFGFEWTDLSSRDLDEHQWRLTMRTQRDFVEILAGANENELRMLHHTIHMALAEREEYNKKMLDKRKGPKLRVFRGGKKEPS